MPLAFAAGIGSMLGSGIIVGLSATIVVWQEGLGLDTTQVGLLSGILTFAIAFGARTVTVEVLAVAEAVRKDDAAAMYREI